MKESNKVLVFQDEVHFKQQTTISRKWALKGSNPKVLSHPGNKSIAYSGYVIPTTGELITTKPGWFNYQTVIDSFKELLRRALLPNGSKYLLILDNAPWYKKALRLIRENKEGEYDDINKSIEFLSLPVYSPDLNPIEQVWRLTRKSITHSRYYPTLEKLITDLDGFLTLLECQMMC